MNNIKVSDIRLVLKHSGTIPEEDKNDMDITLIKLKAFKLGKVVLRISFGGKEYRAVNLFYYILLFPQNKRLLNLLKRALEVV
jgi:hypothetical protein